MAISEALGERHTVQLPQGVLEYREHGSGPPVVFVHGLLVNADLWRGVVPGLAKAGYRCLAPDLPFGGHSLPMPPGTDLSPPSAAAIIADFLERLELDDVTLIANDTGGAITQVLLTTRPERIGRVVFTDSDCFERFFPPQFNYLTKLIRLPGMTWLLTRILRPSFTQRLPITFGWLAKRPIPPEYTRSYLGSSYRDSAIRHDLKAFLSSVHKRHTLAAAQRLSNVDKPVLLAWAPEDRLFPISLAHRLAAIFPKARLVEVPDSYTFIPEDQPARLVELITEFLGEPSDDAQ